MNSVPSYALALLRWWRFLVAVGVAWDRVTAVEVRDFVLWLGQASKPVAAARVASRATAGQVNPIARKRQLGDGYGPAMVWHSNAVLRTFYDFWLERGEGRSWGAHPRAVMTVMSRTRPEWLTAAMPIVRSL